jgi:acetyltransferase-like isoleucine patch superfamily enzyme
MTASEEPVLIPRTSVNEDTARIAGFLVAEGAAVKAGDPVLTLATSKADVEVEAPADGWFWPTRAAGEEVEVGDVVGFVTVARERPAAHAKAEIRTAATGDGPRATRRAQELAAKLGVRLDDVCAPGIIRERDVEAHAASTRAPPTVTGGEPTRRGKLDPEFLAAIQRPGSGFAGLSSELKVSSYRKHGAQIGDGAYIGLGSVVAAEYLSIGGGCQIGRDTSIRAETLEIGDGAILGDENDILCRHIRLGAMLFLVNRVLIGQGGAFNPESELIVGHSCLISSDCLINTAHRVEMGDRSCLSPRVTVYTHSHWQNVLEGYRAVHAPVLIGSDVWITGNCLVAPGTVVEDGAQALAGSVLSGRVPARAIVSGVPAKVVGAARGDLPPAEKDRILRELWGAVTRALSLRGLPVDAAEYTGLNPKGDCRAAVQVGFGARPEGYTGTYFDLERYEATGPDTPAGDEVRNVLRKHGIRLEPHLWRYRADVGRFNA